MNADGTCEHPEPGLLDAGAGPSWQPGSTQPGPLPCVQLRVRTVEARPQIALGEQGDVEVTIENDGNEAATGVTASIDGGQGTTATVPCREGTTAATCTVGTIGPGGLRTIHAYLSRPRAGAAVATLTVRANQPSLADTGRTTLVEQVLPCTIVGTWGADDLAGGPQNDRICGLPGADHLSGGRGNDYLNGGSGQDTLIGGAGRDTIIGGGGADVIYARDGRRDYIDCGTENDIAIVDKLDHVSHCDKVIRR